MKCNRCNGVCVCVDAAAVNWVGFIRLWQSLACAVMRECATSLVCSSGWVLGCGLGSNLLYLQATAGLPCRQAGGSMYVFFFAHACMSSRIPLRSVSCASHACVSCVTRAS